MTSYVGDRKLIIDRDGLSSGPIPSLYGIIVKDGTGTEYLAALELQSEPNGSI